MSVQGQEKAEAIVKEMTAKGYPSPRIIKSEVPGRGVWYRIRMGLFNTREEAEGLSRQLRDRERVQPQVVAEKN
jgi:cell division septation protein DedD